MNAKVYPFAKPADVAGKQPAHDLVAEASVLASCMIDSESAAALLAIANADDFYLGAHRLIAQAIQDLLAAGSPIDMTSVAVRLRELGTMKSVGGPGFIIELCNNVPAISNPKHYAGIVRELANVRRLAESLHRLLAETYEPIADVGAFMARVDATITEVTKCVSKPDVVGALDAAKQVARVLTEAPVPCVTTGFRSLDRMTMGFEPKCFYVLGARPGMGKTALAMQMATSAAQTGHVVLVVSMEMPADQLMRRMICTRSQVPMQTVRDRQMSQSEWQRFMSSASDLAQLPIHFAARAGQTLLDVKARVREFKPAIVLIDHIGLLKGSGASAKRNREQEVAEFSRGLKGLALEAEIPVVALCQVGRDVAKGARRPALSDLRESGSIEQDADSVWFVHRPGYYDPRASEQVAREAEIVVAKQRDGETGIVAMNWDGAFASFSESVS
jgi:replicative DNA helicase